jgi:adenylate cyclase
VSGREGRLSWGRRWRRPIIGAVCALIGALLSAWTGGIIPQADGLLYDLSLAPLSLLAPRETESQVAVVAVDWRSLDADRLAETPLALFSKEWAGVLDRLFAGGAKAVAFDLIFGYSGENFSSGYDAPLLAALERHAGKIVVARSARRPPLDSVYYVMNPDRNPTAVGNAEVEADGDGVYRTFATRLPMQGGETAATIVGNLLAIAGLSAPPELMIAPRRPLDTIPSYSIVDVLDCPAGDAQLATAFRDKIVLVGTSIAEEDQKRSPDRFIASTRPEDRTSVASGCALRPLLPARLDRAMVSGVFLHAAAIDAAIRGSFALTAPAFARIGVAALAGAAGTVLGFTLGPAALAGALPASACALFFASTAGIATQLWLPVALPIAVMLAAVFVAYLVRLLVEERRRRQIQHAFGHYLAPEIVRGLGEEGAALKLGGEMREVTVMFADLGGFTALSGQVSPALLMELTNRYLAFIAEAVEATGGYVDKFIGDAVMAIWGAPLGDPEHATHATDAALRVADRIAAAHAADLAEGRPGFSVKMGLNSGPAIVGNVGTANRYNYTAVGETVNLASRLEGVPNDYGCHIVLGPETARQANAEFLLCELDRIQVKGKAHAVAIYDVIARQQAARAADRGYVSSYAEALERYRRRRFREAAALWRGLSYPARVEAGKAPPNEVMADRADLLAQTPPGPDWIGVFVKMTK